MGSHLLLNLAKTENKVRAIYRKDSDTDAVKRVFSYYTPTSEVAYLFNKIEWVEASLEDIPALTNAFKGIRQVYHCAALVSFHSKDVDALRKINIEGTANIVNLCISVKIARICYISSIVTMDTGPGETQVTENFTWYPEKDHSDYAISKHGAEIEIWRATQEGVPAVILNPGIILGPGFWNKGTGQIFQKVDKGLNYHFPKTSGFVGVQDVAELAVLAMNSQVKNEQFIVVSENLSFKKVFDKIALYYKKRPPQNELKPWMVMAGWIFQSLGYYLFGAEKHISRRDYKSLFEHTLYSNEKVKSAFNYNFTPVEKVISKTAEFYIQDNPKI